MQDFSEQTTFSDRTTAFKELQLSNYKLWQWLDHVTTVWWGPGRRRVVAREDEKGQVAVNPLPPIVWKEVNDRVGTVAAADVGKTLVKEDFVSNVTHQPIQHQWSEGADELRKS